MFKTSQKSRPSLRVHPEAVSGFTLVELLTVIAIMITLMALVVPSLISTNASSGVTKAVYDIAGTLEQARAYAMANNTYVWVGFYEEDADAASPTNKVPPYSGNGRVLIASVISKDGTKIFENNDASATLPALRLVSFGKMMKLQNVHLTDLGKPSIDPASGEESRTLDGRPSLPYQDPGGSGIDHLNRLSSESADKTQFPFVAQGYTFYKTIRFSPTGAVALNSTYSLKRIAEIGLKPTRGNTVDAQNPNTAAIQFTGIAGNVQIYRK